MNIGDKILINDEEWTIWFIEDVYHLLDEFGDGICCTEEYLIQILNP